MNTILKLMVTVFIFGGVVKAESESCIILKKYKEFLKLGTYEGQDWSRFTVQPKSRYSTFKRVFEHFEQIKGKIVVELGTTRSFVHGGLPGCNSSDIAHWAPQNPERWDWGAGCFTRVAAECLQFLNPEIHTIDLCAEHIRRCKLMTENFKHIIRYHICSSVDFLRNCNFTKGIDLLYIDTGDMTPIEHTALLQLEEAKVIVSRNLIAPNGIILIDDIRNQTPRKFGDTSELGKGKYSIPYFLNNGFEIIADEYQVILRRKN